MLPKTYTEETMDLYVRRIIHTQVTAKLNFSSINQSIATLVKEFADSLGCSRELMLYPLLSAVACCMGSEVKVELSPNWQERPVLWFLVGARRGDKKSLALSKVKEAMLSVEREVQALHHRGGLQGGGEGQPTLPVVVDQYNLSSVCDSVRQATDTSSLVVMMDNFGTFLRQLSSRQTEEQLLQPDTLEMLYDGITTVTDADLSSILQHNVNFVGVMEAMDLVSCLQEFDADGLSDRLLVACPLSPPHPLSRLSASPPTTSLTALLSTVTSYHQVRAVKYILAPEAQVLFEQYTAEMEEEMVHFRLTERQRAIYAKAPAQLARLAAVLTALRNALTTVKCGEGVMLPSCTMSKEMLVSAHAILSHCIRQKLLLIPSPDGMLPPDHEEEEFVMDDSAEQDQKGTFSMDESRMVSSSGRPDVIEVPSSPDPTPPWPVAMTAVNRDSFPMAMQMNPVSSHPLRAQVTQVPLIGQPQVLSMQQTTTAVTTSAMNSHPPSCPITMSLPVSLPLSFAHSEPSGLQGMQTLHSQMSMLPVDSLDDSYLSHTLSSPYGMGPHYQRKLKSRVNINDLSDQELLEFASQKIRRLLLLDGMLFASATICQKKLFPSIPRHLRPSNPQTTHPVWGAVNFMARIAKMGLGEVVHQVYRVRSHFFRKIRLEFMSEAARDLLKELNIIEEDYERTYPKTMDTDIMKNYVVVRDLDSLRRNDPDVDAFILPENHLGPEGGGGGEGEMGEKVGQRLSWQE